MSNNLARVHGDVQPVFAIDTRNGPVASTAAPAGVATNFIGPALAFFGMDIGADPATQMAVGGAVEAVIQCVTQLSVIQLYQVEATSGALSMAVYPVGAWTAATLQTAVRALGTVNGYDLSGATVTDVGFKLATA
jgi:hypothetical protein